MLFDSEAGMTLEQSIEITWNKLLSPSVRAQVLALAEATGQTRNEIILECQEICLKSLEDPVTRAAFHARWNGRQPHSGKTRCSERPVTNDRRGTPQQLSTNNPHRPTAGRRATWTLVGDALRHAPPGSRF